ncbi:MAG TPA: RIP metalloprotease RseP, partial [Vicinamibacterales bacterium]|nr:RIP metalloprotease RseP [Vicinamibacterales bacterium]
MITILAFLFVLGVLVFVHELGHFLMARFYGVRVLRFSLGFDPKIFKFTRGGTEYSIGIIPLGGFVKMAGETVEDERTGAPDEFLSKSKWIRFQVYLAGPAMNLLLAFLVLAGVLMRGADVPLYLSSPPVIGAVEAGSAAERAGLQPGDRVVSVNGRDVPTWEALDLEITPKANTTLAMTIERRGTKVTLEVTPASYSKYELGDLGVRPVLRPQFLLIQPGLAADHAGLERGDVVLAVNGERGLDQPAVIDRIKKNPGTPIVFTIERAGEPRDITVTPDKSGLIGVQLGGFEVKRVDPTILQAFAMSARQNWENTVLIGRTVRGLISRELPVRQLMGPIAIAELSGSAARLGWLALLQMMSMISLNLGLINLLPVPVLDGGHMAILLVEGAARRDLSTRVKERVLLAGAALIVLLMVTVIYNDVMRLFR